MTESTISGSVWIKHRGLKMPSRPWPIPMSKSESNANKLEGPHMRKATTLQALVEIIMARLSMV